MFADPLLRLLTTIDVTSSRALLSAAAQDEIIERSVLLGGTTDTALQELGVIDEATALQLIAEAYQLPVADRNAQSAWLADDLVPALRASMPRKLAESHGVCPVVVDGRKLTVLCHAPADKLGFLAGLEELGFAMSMFLSPVVTTEALLARAVERVYGTPVSERLLNVLSPTSIDIDFDAEGIELVEPPPLSPSLSPPRSSIERADHSGWSALSPAAAPAVTAPQWQPSLDDNSGWRVSGPGQAVLPSSDAGLTAPKLEVVVDGTLTAALPEALRQQQLVAQLDAQEAARRLRRREKVLWSVDDAVSELALGETRDDLLEVALRFAWRRLQTAAIFVRVGSTLTCFDVLDPWLEAHDLRAFPLSADGEHVVARSMSLKSPSVGPIDEADPLVRLLGRKPRAVVVVPILLGDRAIGAVIGDNGDKAVASTVLAELQAFVPRLGKALGALVLRARRAATVPSTLPSPAIPEPVLEMPAIAAAAIPAAITPAPVVVSAPPLPTRAPTPMAMAAVDVGPALPPSPGAKAREALLQATARAWLAHPVDDEAEALVATLQQDVESARAAVARVTALGSRALPALARAFPGAKSSLDESAADAANRLLATPLFDVIRRLGEDRAAPIVVFALDHKDRHVRFGAVVACKQLEIPAALPGLGRRLFDPEPRIAALATDALAHSRDLPGYDAVLTRLRDLCRRGDDTERRFAVRALAGLRDVEAMNVLIDLLPVRPRELAEEARLALVEITRQDFGVAERRWRAWLADHGSAPRRRWLLDALAHRELPLRRAAAEDLADEGVALFGYRADASPGDRHDALVRLCHALREPVPA